MRECPTENQIQALFTEQLPAAERGFVESHLETCSHCQSGLDQWNSSINLLHQSNEQALESGQEATFLQNDLLDRWTNAIRQSTHAPDASPETKQSRLLRQSWIGDYQLLEQLGEGGMGVVYKARHTRLNKIVAIKLLQRGKTGQQELARFNREMIVSGAIDHPHIVQATDAGEADGCPYLVMEYLHGIDLCTLLKSHGPLSTADACELIRQAALGLQEAHDHGIIHRDLKPANLMLCSTSSVVKKREKFSDSTDQPIVKVLDLGLAILNNALEAVEELTENGQVMGTLDYMAPEQLSDTHSVGTPADLYSLGATLWKLLTGKSPGEREGIRSPIVKAVQRMNESAPSISGCGVELPADLISLIDSLVQQQPQDRPDSASEVAQRLAPFCSSHRLNELLEQAEAVRNSELDPAMEGTGEIAQGDTDPQSESPLKQPPVAFSQDFPAAESPTVSMRTGGNTDRGTPAKVWAAAAGGAMLLVLAAIVFFFPREDGTTIRVEITDPSIEVTLKEQQIIIKQGDDPVTVSPGQHTLHIQRGNLSFKTQAFELKDGETLQVKVRLLDKQIQVVRNGDIINSQPVEQLPPENIKPVPQSKFQLTPQQQQFVEETRKLPMEEQIEVVEAKFEEINPAMRNPQDGYPVHAKENPKAIFEFQNGVPFSCKLTNWRITRFWPLVVFSSLTSLDISEASITDLRPLQLLPKLIHLKHNIAVANVETENQLKAMATLHVINNQSPEAFFARRVSIRNEIQELKEAFTSLPLTVAREQVAGLLKKLNPGWDIETQRLCGFDGDVYHMRMELIDQTRDLSPLGALPLNGLYLVRGRAYDLSFLRGMPLSKVTLEQMPLMDLSPLQGLPLEQLHVRGCGVSDLTPLTGMPLQDLSLKDNVVSDLAPLRGMPLTRLELNHNPVSDLAPLGQMKLTSLSCLRTLVTDISPLRGMPLEELFIHNYRNGTNFKEDGVRVADISPIKGMPLKRFATNFRTYFQPDIDLVKSLPLETLGYTHGGDPSVEGYWKRFEAARAAEATLVKRLLELPAAERVEAVIQEMNKTLPSKKPYRIVAVFQDGKVTEITYRPYHREENSLYLLQAFPHLRKLKLKLLGKMTGEMDLSPVMQLRIEELEIDHEELEFDYLVAYNLPVLRDMQHLKKLNGKPAAEVLPAAGRKQAP